MHTCNPRLCVQTGFVRLLSDASFDFVRKNVSIFFLSGLRYLFAIFPGSSNSFFLPIHRDKFLALGGQTASSYQISMAPVCAPQCEISGDLLNSAVNYFAPVTSEGMGGDTS